LIPALVGAYPAWTTLNVAAPARPMKGMTMSLKLILLLLLLSLAVVFVAQNATMVEIDFLVWRASMSSALLIFFCLMTGFVIGWFVRGHLVHRREASKSGELMYLP
jgi:uncharacterized integral membrane protein